MRCPEPCREWQNQEMSETLSAPFSVEKVNHRKAVLLFRDAKQLHYLPASWEVSPAEDKTSMFDFLMLKAKMRSF